MKNHIIHDSSPIILVGGGELAWGDLDLALQWGQSIVAADGGANAILDAGYIPNTVIGDFDSIDSSRLESIPSNRLFKVDEQETTDFEKCLMRIESPLIIGVGFSGYRLDHELATLSALAKYPDRRCILIGTHMVTFLAPQQMTLDLQQGDIVSLYPLGSVRGTSTGLTYPIENIEFSPLSQIGTSNCATGQFCAEFDAPRMLVLLPRDRLAEACDMLLSNEHRWHRDAAG